MSTYDYEPAYPINTEAGTTETERSSLNKIKAEFERLYRILNSSFANVEAMINDARDLITDATETFTQLAQTLRSEMTALNDRLTALVDTKTEQASTIGQYVGLASTSGTATENGFLVVWFDNSGNVTGQLKINGTVVGNYTGDGTYGGACVTGTFPIQKGQSWQWSGSYLKLMFVSLGA